MPDLKCLHMKKMMSNCSSGHFDTPTQEKGAQRPNQISPQRVKPLNSHRTGKKRWKELILCSKQYLLYTEILGEHADIIVSFISLQQDKMLFLTGEHTVHYRQQEINGKKSGLYSNFVCNILSSF